MIIKFALDFSTQNNIVLSDQWANLIPENGLDGGPTDSQKLIEAWKKRNRVMSEETKQKIANGVKRRRQAVPISSETRKKMSERMSGSTISQETKMKISNSLKGKQRSPEHSRRIAISNTGKKRNTGGGGETRTLKASPS